MHFMIVTDRDDGGDGDGDHAFLSFIFNVQVAYSSCLATTSIDFTPVLTQSEHAVNENWTFSKMDAAE
jgi:hypothetical protein